jgi:hypothetical protein
MKKEATLKNEKGLVQKTSDEKRSNLEKCKGARSKDNDEKRGNPKNFVASYAQLSP